jgi:hypothetical protein
MENNRNAKIMGGLVLVGVIVGAYFLFKKGGLDGMEPQQAEYYKGKAIIKNNDGSFTVKHGPNKPSTTHKSLVKAKRRIDFNKSKAASAVLQLMDKDFSYTEALKKVLSENRKLTREKLEKELDLFI